MKKRSAVLESFLNESMSYNEMIDYISKETNGGENSEGSIKFDSEFDLQLGKDILKDMYQYVEDDEPSLDDNVYSYVVNYSKEVRESLEEEYEGETCPTCGSNDTTWLGSQGKMEEFKCNNCDEYFYKDNCETLSSKQVDDKYLTDDLHQELNSKLWDKDDELRPEVRTALENVLDVYTKSLKKDGINLKVDDVRLVGSNASYNYSDKSDLDMHIYADLSIYEDKEDLAQKLYDAYRRLFEYKYDPVIRGIDVEVYVEPTEEVEDVPGVVSNGVYSLYKGWISEPERKEIPEEEDIEDDVNKLRVEAEDCTTEEDIDNFLDKLHKMRQDSILKDGEYGKDNLIFKALRNDGTIQELKDRKIELKNELMSVKEKYAS